jgi:hypothetical protein
MRDFAQRHTQPHSQPHTCSARRADKLVVRVAFRLLRDNRSRLRSNGQDERASTEPVRGSRWPEGMVARSHFEGRSAVASGERSCGSALARRGVRSVASCGISGPR